MILTKQDLTYYLAEDKRALGKSGSRRPNLLGDDVWKFEIVLRKHEFYNNSNSSLIGKIMRKFYSYRHSRLGVKLGFSIPVNVFGPGLRINHYGMIVINGNARIGANCDIHQMVNIGQNLEAESVPTIGDNTWIGPGVKIFGGIEIADGIAIGANSVVNKSFRERDITIAGIPARKIKDAGTSGMETAASLK